MFALVTGATGFVGSHLVEELLARGWRVRCTVRSTSRLRWLEGRKVETATADLSDPATLPAACEGVDAVFHVAGLLRGDSWAEYRAGNWGTTRNLLDAAPTSARFVFVSSLAACGPSRDGRPVDEDSPCEPVSKYGRSKLEAEREVWKRRGERPVTVIRPPVVYGPRDEGLLELYQALAKGIQPVIGGPKHVSIVHAADLARAIADSAGAAGQGRLYFASNAEPQSFTGLMDLILRALGTRAIKIRIPDRVVHLLGAVAEDATRLLGRGGLFTRDKAIEMTQKWWTCSPERAKRELGWESRIPLADGLRDTLAWYRAEDLL